MGFLNYFREKNKKDEFREIYEKYYPVIFRNISYLTGDSYAAEDLAQETFIKLYNEPPGHSNTAAWLNRVATNLSYNYLRNKKLRNEKNEMFLKDDLNNFISIEDEAIKNYELKLTKKILDMMAPRDKMCLLLKFSGYKYTEISEIIGIDKNSIGTILSRAQSKFKDMYLKEGNGGEYNEMST